MGNPDYSGWVLSGEILEGVAKMGSTATLRIVSHALEQTLTTDKRLVGLLELPMFRGAEVPSTAAAIRALTWV